MESAYVLLLSFIVFLPAAGAIVLTFFPPSKPEAMRYFTLAITLLVLVPTLWMAWPGGTDPRQFDIAHDRMQQVFSLPWIPSFNIYYFMGLDGISFPLVLLTAFISVLAMAASWSITRHVKAYCILFLLLETGMLGVFMALDFFLFYVFWEVMLLPMYFLIGVWGGPRKEYAAIKFFLYTLFGSVLMLIAILMLYFHSDVRELALRSDFYGDSEGEATFSWNELGLPDSVDGQLGRTTVASGRRNAELHLFRLAPDAGDVQVRFVQGAAGGGQTTAVYHAPTKTVSVYLADGHATAADAAAALAANPFIGSVLDAAVPAGSDGSGALVAKADDANLPAVSAGNMIHTFNILALTAMGQHTTLFDVPILFGLSLQWWAFVLLGIGFIIKVPSVPVHTWLPDAHVEAPTPISMILAGVLLKMGGYGILRICYPICPDAGYDLAFWVCLIGLVSMVYGAFAAMAQTDFKRLVAYSSVSHMGYVVLGMGVWSASAGNYYNADYWNLGVKGAMFQMIAHGISSAGMFFMVGVLYDRVHHRNLNDFGGLFGKMPLYTALAIGIFFAGLGLPGLCGFWGEAFVVLSVWNYSPVMTVVAAGVVIITAAYILWTIQRVYLGAEYKGPHEEALTPITGRELAVAVPLFIVAIWFGVYPASVLRYMDATIDRQVQELADWTRDVKEPRLARQRNEAGGTGEVARPEFAPPREARAVGPRMDAVIAEAPSPPRWTSNPGHPANDAERALTSNPGHPANDAERALTSNPGHPVDGVQPKSASSPGQPVFPVADAPPVASAPR
jgi:NADH:ubiquinone oxidoreductase subunit 4 (subunit M)